MLNNYFNYKHEEKKHMYKFILYSIEKNRCHSWLDAFMEYRKIAIGFFFTTTTFVFVSCGQTNGKIKYTWSSFSEIFKSLVLRSNNSQDIKSPYQPQGEVSSHEYHDWPGFALTAVTFWRFSWGVVVRNRSEDQNIEFLDRDRISFKKSTFVYTPAYTNKKSSLIVRYFINQ